MFHRSASCLDIAVKASEPHGHDMALTIARMKWFGVLVPLVSLNFAKPGQEGSRALHDIFLIGLQVMIVGQSYSYYS